MDFVGHQLEAMFPDNALLVGSVSPTTIHLSDAAPSPHPQGWNQA